MDMMSLAVGIFLGILLTLLVRWLRGLTQEVHGYRLCLYYPVTVYRQGGTTRAEAPSWLTKAGYAAPMRVDGTGETVEAALNDLRDQAQKALDWDGEPRPVIPVPQLPVGWEEQ